ncbi:unnamed protein product [Prorocentrum cordatum]|uniref:Uncharacterized protein n=1 Tax=Prorocentrum cordatum TaxID=2364126 RepID=A0ABN9X301_9DINO|nr:unnamed protein product [Polarella glacialis]CAK0893664.1 unnamed protein product [Polarella glacialis]
MAVQKARLTLRWVAPLLCSLSAATQQGGSSACADYAGEYEVWYDGSQRSETMIISCDCTATQGAIFTDSLRFTDVSSQCPNDDSSFYILNTHGAGKYECLAQSGTTISGNHYTTPDATDPLSTEYRLTRRDSCNPCGESCPICGQGQTCAEAIKCQMDQLTSGFGSNNPGDDGVLENACSVGIAAVKDQCSACDGCTECSVARLLDDARRDSRAAAQAGPLAAATAVAIPLCLLAVASGAAALLAGLHRRASAAPLAVPTELGALSETDGQLS